MKKHHMPEMKEGGVNVTPLIDIVMCLIIFFMLVAKIGISSGINKDVDSPQTYLGVKMSDMSNALALNLYDKKGSTTDEPMILVDLKGEKQKEIKLQDNKGGKVVHPLQEVLKDMKKDRNKDGKDLFKVIINCDKNMKYASVQLVLQECAIAGVTQINFATKKQTKSV